MKSQVVFGAVFAVGVAWLAYEANERKKTSGAWERQLLEMQPWRREALAKWEATRGEVQKLQSANEARKKAEADRQIDEACEQYWNLRQARRELHCYADASVRECKILIFHSAQISKMLDELDYDVDMCRQAK